MVGKIIIAVLIYFILLALIVAFFAACGKLDERYEKDEPFRDSDSDD